IGMPVVHVVEAVRFGTDPERPLPVDEERVRTHRAAVEPGNDEAGPPALGIALHAEPRSDAVEAGPHPARRTDGDIDGAVAAGRVRQLLVEVRGERAGREAAHHLAGKPQRAIGLRGEAKRVAGGEAVLLAVADQTFADDAAQRSHAVIHAVAGHPDRSRAIFDDGRYARTFGRRRVVEEMAVLEAAQTGDRADPQAPGTGPEDCAQPGR